MKKLAKTNALIIIFFLLLCSGFGQVDTFIFKYSTLQDEVPTDAVGTPDGGFIIAAKQGDRYLYSYHTLLIKLDQHGDTVLTKKIINADGNCYIYDLMKCDDGNYFGFGSSQFDSSEMNLWIIKIDSDLNILFDKKYHSNCQDISMVNGLRNHNEEILLYGDGYTDMVNYNDIFILRVNQNGDSLNYRIFPDPGSEYALSMIEIPDTSGYYMMILGRYQINLYTWGQILKFDHDFNVVNIDSIPNHFLSYYNSLIINNNILLTGLQVVTFPNDPAAEKLGIMKLDSSYNILVKYSIGSDSRDSLSYPGYIHNLDSADIQNIYYGGTFNQDNNFILSPKKSWYVLAKFDSSLNLKWEKYYGGDSYYGLWSVNATLDGGCLLSGSIFDYLTQDNERDILIIKIDSNGVYTGVNGQSFVAVNDAIVYPNPGNDQLNIRTGLKEVFIELTEASGKVLFRKKLQQGSTTVNVGNLPSGVYFYRLLQKGSVKESGKWIKE